MKWNLLDQSRKILKKRWEEFQNQIIDYNKKNSEIILVDKFEDFREFIIKAKLNCNDVFLTPWLKGFFDFKNYSITNISDKDGICGYHLESKVIDMNNVIIDDMIDNRVYKDFVFIFGVHKMKLDGAEVSLFFPMNYQRRNVNMMKIAYFAK